MKRLLTGRSVVDASLDRIRELYRQGHRVVTTFSGGKDSTVLLFLALQVAREFDRLPLDVVYRDEEVETPPTAEFVERIAAMPDINFVWSAPGHPVLRCWDRDNPFFWTFDREVDPSLWVRRPPANARMYEEAPVNIRLCVNTRWFPAPEGRETIGLTGVRAGESAARNLALHSVGSWLHRGRITNHPAAVRNAWPIYDWAIRDVWWFIRTFKLPYSPIYDYALRYGVRVGNARVGPPTMNFMCIRGIRYAIQAFPEWVERVDRRLPGFRLALLYEKHLVTPVRRPGERWRDTFQRVCIDEAPHWVRVRAERVMKAILKIHAQHSASEFPDSRPCTFCKGAHSWKELAERAYFGDPFQTFFGSLVGDELKPTDFRPYARDWNDW